jgi:hypothetical protein
MKPTNGISHKPPATLTQRHSNGYSSPSSCSPQSSSTLKSLLDKSERDKCFKPISSLKSSYFRQTPTNTATTTTNNNNHNENDHDDDSSNENETDNRDSLCSSPVTTSITALSGSYESLNTADIAQKVRDLLSMHNIGQRIFAKYILGLSQGTVSELLSKPKHWDKLTEKGRESYRKMHSWSCSDENINSLKAISPRKGNKDNYFYQSGAKDDTDLKITQILYEAQKQMQGKGRSVHDGYSASSPSASMSSASPSPINQNSEDENNNNEDRLG